MLADTHTQGLLETAITAFTDRGDWQEVLDEIPIPAYTTDADGAVTYWNQACVNFAGRQPQLGEDQWCVTWRLYTLAGDPLPHDDCPMAEAIKSRRPVRDKVAIAMRPDGTRRAFKPYPTPLFDETGDMNGAVNLLVDVSHEQANALEEQASRCRRLLQATTDLEACKILSSMARSYADVAASLRSSEQPA